MGGEISEHVACAAAREKTFFASAALAPVPMSPHPLLKAMAYIIGEGGKNISDVVGDDETVAGLIAALDNVQSLKTLWRRALKQKLLPSMPVPVATGKPVAASA